MEHYYTRLFNYIAEILILPEAGKTSIRQLFKPFFVIIGIGIVGATMGMWLPRL